MQCMPCGSIRRESRWNATNKRCGTRWGIYSLQRIPNGMNAYTNERSQVKICLFVSCTSWPNSNISILCVLTAHGAQHLAYDYYLDSNRSEELIKLFVVRHFPFLHFCFPPLKIEICLRRAMAMAMRWKWECKWNYIFEEPSTSI